MDLQLSERVIVVVGGTGVIGSAVVERLRAEGAIAIPATRSGSGELGISLDTGDERSLHDGFETVLEQYGRLDGVVMTAAPSAGALNSSADPDVILEAINKKAMAFLRVANVALPLMARAGFGRLVAVSGQNALLSTNLILGVRNVALNTMAKTVADSYAGSGVTVNVVNPGHVLAHPSPRVMPGRPGDSTPENNADLIAFLLSPLAGAISGESLSMGHRVLGQTVI